VLSTISESGIIESYLEHVSSGRVVFLTDPRERDELSVLLSNLSESGMDLHRKIEVGKRIWKVLFRNALSFLSPDRRGYTKLFGYFDEFVEFEELIFASDAFYRDHTMHSLWVYFLGEHLIRSPIFGPFFKDMYSESVSDGVESLEMLGHDDLARHFTVNQDSLRCVAALCHDLGYPIKTMGKIGTAMSRILPYFNVEAFSAVRFTFSEEHQYFVDAFLKVLSCNLSLHTSDAKCAAICREMGLLRADGREIDGYAVALAALKEMPPEKRKDAAAAMRSAVEFRNPIDHHVFMRRAKQLEQRDHGLMSAYLLASLVPCFTGAAFTFQEHWHSSEDIRGLAPMGILTALADHSSGTFRFRGMLGLSEFLTIVDAVEEFSRISRASQRRQYVNEFCKTALDYADGWLEVAFIFDRPELEEIKPEIFFKDRCRFFLSVLDIPNLKDAMKLRLKVIDRMRDEQVVFALEACRSRASIRRDGEGRDIRTYLGTEDFPRYNE